MNIIYRVADAHSCACLRFRDSFDEDGPATGGAAGAVAVVVDGDGAAGVRAPPLPPLPRPRLCLPPRPRDAGVLAAGADGVGGVDFAD
jgi:hypothetical protein